MQLEEAELAKKIDIFIAATNVVTLAANFVWSTIEAVSTAGGKSNLTLHANSNSKASSSHCLIRV